MTPYIVLLAIERGTIKSPDMTVDLFMSLFTFTRFCLIYCQICNCAHIYLLRFLFLTSFLEVQTFCAMEFTSNYYVIFKFWVWEFDSCTEIFFPFILIIDLLGSMSVTLQSALYVTDLFMFTFLSLLVFFELAKYVKLFYLPIFNWLNILLLFFPVCVYVYHIDVTYFKASVAFTTLPSHCWGDC